MKKSDSIKPPFVFIVPFTLLTFPMFILGTLWAFIEIGFRSGNAGVFRIYFAKQEAAYQAEREKRHKEAAEEMAARIKEALGRDGVQTEIEVHDIEKKND